MDALRKKELFTTKEIYALPDGERAELIDGQIYNMAPPGRMHQKLSGKLYQTIVNYIDSQKGDCEAYAAPFGVFLYDDDLNYLEPDISVICDPFKLDEKGCHGAPDWIIEIVSPASKRMDYFIKLFQYRTAGVREYWIVDPGRELVTVYQFEAETMEQYSFGEEATGDPSYEQNAVRNLRMMLTYWEPDDSIFTANSTRFDKDRLVFPGDYYIEYLKMGMKYDIPEFLQMCNTIFEIVDRHHINSPDFLIWFMLHPEYRKLEVEGSYHRTDFERFYQESGIARGQQGRFTYTVMNGKSNFLYLHNGSIKLEMKVAGSFCEHRAFRGEQMERVSRGEYHLSQTMRGWYYLPFAEKPSTSDWWKMDNASREKKTGPDMQIDVWVKEVENGLDVRVRTSGVEGAPWRIELAFSGVDFLSNEYVDLPLTGSEVIVVKKGDTEVGNGRDTLVVGPCFGEHHFTEGKEDSEAKTPGAATLYLTAYTPFDREIRIRDKVSGYLHFRTHILH